MNARGTWNSGANGFSNFTEGDRYDAAAMDSLGEPVDLQAWRTGHEPKAPTFSRIINPAEWEGLPVPPREWIVPDYIPDRTVSLLGGDGATGKSLLALQLAAARALAREWIGLLPEPGRTLVLSAEDDADEMQRRFDDIRKFYGAKMADLSDIRLVDLVGEDSILGSLIKGQIEPTAMYRALDSYATEFKPGLTILDVLADMFAGDENNRAQVRQFIGLLKKLARKHDCAFLLLAHPSLTGMSTGTGTSGSTGWRRRAWMPGKRLTGRGGSDEATPRLCARGRRILRLAGGAWGDDHGDRERACRSVCRVATEGAPAASAGKARPMRATCSFG